MKLDSNRSDHNKVSQTFSFHNTFLPGNYVNTRRKSFGGSAVFLNQLPQTLIYWSLRETSGFVFCKLELLREELTNV